MSVRHPQKKLVKVWRILNVKEYKEIKELSIVP